MVPDRDHVFITTGEHFTLEERQFAQDPDRTYGKVIRLSADGAVPADNPFADRGGPAALVWSLGHRNVLDVAASHEGSHVSLTHVADANAPHHDAIARGRAV